MSNSNNGEEVPVIPPPRRIAKIQPDYFTVVLPYYETYRDGSNPQTTNTNRHFRLNSIFDPDQTSTGHQPMGRDTWAGIYKYYRVIKTDVKITWQNFSNVGFTGETQVVGFELTDDTSSELTDNTIAFMEAKQCAPLILPGQSFQPLNMQTQQYT